MARVLFVNGLLGGDFSSLDIAITLLSTWINKKTDHRAQIADLTFHSRHWQQQLDREIQRKRPEVIALSCNTMYMKYVRRIVAEIRKKYDQKIVLGGHHATIFPDEVFSIPGVDAVVVGDGEWVFQEYLDRLTGDQNFDDIPGLWVRQDSGKEIRNPGVGFSRDIDQLGCLDWNLWDELDKYFYFLGMLYVQGSRGCPYRCTFCDAQGFAQAIKKGGHKYFRLREPESFVAELEEYYSRYHDRGMRLFQVFDPVFTMNDSWVQSFCDAYRASGLHKKIRYSVFSRIDHLNEDKVRLLAESGCALLRVGVEAGDDSIRQDIYKKKIDTEKIRRIFSTAHDNGLNFTAFYILGGPFETQKTFRKTIKLAWDLDAARSAFFVFKPFTEKGKEQVSQSGGKVDSKRWEQVDNISFGAATSGKDWGPGIVEAYQLLAYGLTFGRRWIRTLRRTGPKYFADLAEYMFRAYKSGLDLRYAIMYFHIYFGDNIDR